MRKTEARIRLTLSGRRRLSSMVLLSAVLLLVCASCGTTSISGRLVDEQNQPIKGASIETQPRTDFLLSNYGGSFVIDRSVDELNRAHPISPGNYKVVLKKLGYKDRVLDVTLEEGDEHDLGAILLKRKEIEMGEVPDVEPSAPPPPGVGYELGVPKRGE